MIRGSAHQLSRVPIIAITAFGDNYQERAIDAGCNQLISKPVDFDVLEPLIEQYFTH